MTTKVSQRRTPPYAPIWRRIAPRGRRHAWLLLLCLAGGLCTSVELLYQPVSGQPPTAKSPSSEAASSDLPSSEAAKPVGSETAQSADRAADQQDVTGHSVAVELPRMFERDDLSAWFSDQQAAVDAEVLDLWLTAYVKVPDDWASREGLMAQSVTWTLENMADAAEVFVNGQQIGSCGAWSADQASARDEIHRFKVPPGLLEAGKYNVLELHVRGRDGRVGWLGRAPVLSGYLTECVMRGTWLASSQRNPREKMGAVEQRPDRALYEEFQPGTSLLKRPATLLPGRRLPPIESLQTWKLNPDLRVDLVLSEPQISQPISIDFDAQGRLWVVEYRQYPYPAGIQMVSRDKYYRAVYNAQPEPPPHHAPGLDRISVHTDADQDGVYESHTTFVDGLNIVSSIEVVPDGVWVLNPPYLLFYPDRNHDLQPDGDPEVHLRGFGLEDTHSIANSLTWSPDGWLVGAQGSTTSSRITVVANGSAESEPQPGVYRDGAMIWRYHPQQRRYEIWAEGGGNSFGIEIDSRGRIFSGHNGGHTRGFHYVGGGYYQKGTDDKYGPLSNPFAFGNLAFMPHAESPRFSHDLVKYESVGLPAHYHGQWFAIDPLNQLGMQFDMQANGAGFRTTDQGPAFQASDLAFRPIDLTVGPDGALYVADFCEEYIAHGQHYQGQVDVASGRVFRIGNREPSQHVRPQLVVDDATIADSIKALSDRNKWVRRETLKQFSAPERLKTDVDSLRQALVRQVDGGELPAALEALWGANLLKSVDAVELEHWLEHKEPTIRGWAIRLLGDREPLPIDTSVDLPSHRLPSVLNAQLTEKLLQLAHQEPDAEVRCQLASTARRLPLTYRLPLAAHLARHTEDLHDPYQGLMIWWLVEAAVRDGADAASWLTQEKLWHEPLVQEYLLERIMRRYASGNRREQLMCATLLAAAPANLPRERLLRGLEQAFAGRSMSDLPEAVLRELAAQGGGGLALQVRAGDPAAAQQLMQQVLDSATAKAERISGVQLLSEVQPQGAQEALLQLLTSSDDTDLVLAALQGLQAFSEPVVAEQILQQLHRWPPLLRDAALRILASRRPWAIQLIGAIEAEQIPPEHVDAAFLPSLLRHADADLHRRIARIWDVDTSEDQATEIARQLQRVEAALSRGDADPYAGRQLFAQVCGRCHRLFREGATVGPDLTGYQRHDLSRLMVNIVQPSSEIREGYEQWVVETDEGRIVTGFLVDESPQSLVMRTIDMQLVTIAAASVIDRQRSGQSLMPDGLLTPLNDQQLRDLFAYLRIGQPLNE